MYVTAVSTFAVSTATAKSMFTSTARRINIAFIVTNKNGLRVTQSLTSQTGYHSVPVPTVVYGNVPVLSQRLFSSHASSSSACSGGGGGGGHYHSFNFGFPFFDRIKAAVESQTDPSRFSVFPPSGSLVQNQAPDFTADAVYADDSIKPLTLSSFKGQSYVVLFFYPLDFTFVCPSEIIAYNERLKDFKSRNVEVIGVSVDSQFSHHAWKQTPKTKGGIGDIQFPLVADLSKEISRKYGVLVGAGTVALRGLFLIDKQGIVRYSVVNDLPLGRSVDETLRMIDALQHFEESGEVCPANWKKGKKAMKASPEGVAEYLSNKD